jgi:hypothetical protein
MLRLLENNASPQLTLFLLGRDRSDIVILMSTMQQILATRVLTLQYHIECNHHIVWRLVRVITISNAILLFRNVYSVKAIICL